MNNTEKITKPITLLRSDFIASVVELCNNSGLPFFAIEDVLKNITQEVHVAAKQQLDNDQKKYQELLKQQEDA